MSIPKIIHYCWFGKGELPSLTKKCMESWKKHCPEYQIIEWNESNFDISSNIYVKQAYEARKYAFVSDYVRLYALYNYGGIYMDTDVEVLKPLDKFLNNEAFSGFESIDRIGTGIMACIKGQDFFRVLLSYYNNKEFIKDNGEYDLTTNVDIITQYCINNGLILDNTLQCIKGFKLYPQEYFSPKNLESGKIHITNKSHSIHHFDGSWLSRSYKLKRKIIRTVGPKATCILVKIKRIFKNANK